MPRTQANRKSAVITPLGDDVLLLKSFAATEELGRLFSFELELASEKLEIKFEDIVGQNATVRLALNDGKTRYFNGYVSRFIQMPGQGGLALYQATLVPWLWFLTRVADCRIFQEMNAPDIIQQVFRDQGFTDFKLSLSESYRQREFCVQYRETDFNFVSRLMEDEGIYYYFEHENGKHSLVLADSKSAHAAYEGCEKVVHRLQDQPGIEQDYVFDWSVEQEVQTGIVCLNDFDFKKPSTALTVKANISRQHAAPRFETFDYPGDYVNYGDGESLARRRIEELQVRHERVHGKSRVKGLCTGFLFTLDRHDRADQNREYLIVSSASKIASDTFDTVKLLPGEEYFDCAFTAIDSNTPFRSAHATRKPFVQGPQTAMVVGPAGDEIYVDKYGRVKVQFHWDHRGKGDENSSCWLRVSQLWAGKTWGAMHVPRIGQEVIVDFLEGDPDRPIITGRVYNGESMPPYPLPDQMTLSTVKSNSSKGGKGFNEIRFDDKKGEEQIFIHGEKNQDVRIKNDCFEWIGNDRHLIVKNDQFESVENNRNEIVTADHKEKIGKDRHLKVAGKEAKEVVGSLSLTVKDDVIEVFKANHSEQTTNDYYLKADNIVIEGMTNVTLKVGGSSIAIAADGIAIKTDGLVKIEAGSTLNAKAGATMELKAGATMDIKADAPLTIQSSATAEMKSAATTVKGDGMLTLKGGIVMIN
jgi:type VI secretion system secreted protein VgrG